MQTLLTGGQNRQKTLPFRKQRWGYGKALPDRETSPSPTSPAERLETCSPLCRWCKVALQGQNRPRSAARFCDLWCWAVVAVFQSTQIADETPPPSLVSTKPRCVPGHRPAAATPHLEARLSPCGRAIRTLWPQLGCVMGVARTLPWMWAPTTVHADLSSRPRGPQGDPGPVLRASPGPCRAPSPTPLCRREAGPHRGSGAGCLWVWFVGFRSPEVLGALAGAIGPGRLSVWLWGSVCLGRAAQLAGSSSPTRGLTRAPGSASPVVTVDCQEAPGRLVYGACFELTFLEGLY